MSRFYGFYYLATRIAQQDGNERSDPAKRDSPSEDNAGLLVMIVAIIIIVAATLLLLFTV